MGLQVAEVDGSVDDAGGVNQLKSGWKAALDGGAVVGGPGGTGTGTPVPASSTSTALVGEEVDPLRKTRLKKEDERGVRLYATSPAAVEMVGWMGAQDPLRD
jgi:hypothetical protein